MLKKRHLSDILTSTMKNGLNNQAVLSTPAAPIWVGDTNPKNKSSLLLWSFDDLSIPGEHAYLNAFVMSASEQ